MDWTYEEMGIVSFSTELWDLETEAGVQKVGYYNLRPRTEDIQAKVFDWVLENVGEKGYRDWQPFDHPQLGPVEIGGMVYIWTYRNPPPNCWRRSAARTPRSISSRGLRAAGAGGRFTSEKLGDDLYKVRAVVSNHGYLPTNLTDVAIQNGVAKPVAVSIGGDGITVLMNPETVEIGHLAGRNERKYTWSPWGQQWSAGLEAARMAGARERRGRHRRRHGGVGKGRHAHDARRALKRGASRLRKWAPHGAHFCDVATFT